MARLYGCRELNSQKRRFPARVDGPADGLRPGRSRGRRGLHGLRRHADGPCMHLSPSLHVLASVSTQPAPVSMPPQFVCMHLSPSLHVIASSTRPAAVSMPPHAQPRIRPPSSHPPPRPTGVSSPQCDASGLTARSVPAGGGAGLLRDGGAAGGGAPDAARHPRHYLSRRLCRRAHVRLAPTLSRRRPMVFICGEALPLGTY